MKKRLLILAVVLVLVIIGGYLIYSSRVFQMTSAGRIKDQAPKEYTQIKSSVDKDGDGVDDQTDILQGALDYMKTKPKYKSKYYDTGYPNDEFGVCTDLVANACLAAGYDWMQLVNEDVLANPDDYQIDKPDINIDFRRVPNLRVYLEHTAISLTTDIYDTEQWQGGDIVVFKNHIGIVSNRRNKDGVTYVIHHNDPLQKSYEQDILEKRKDIVGHYRISK